MENFIIFYATSEFYDSVVVDAEFLDDAFKIAKSFSRVHAVTIIGVFLQSSYIELHPHE